MPNGPEYDRAETVNQIMRRGGLTLAEYRRRMRSQYAQQQADNEKIAEEERERLSEEDQ